MRMGKLCTIGDSKGLVIHQAHLEQLGWMKGDHLEQVILGNELVIRNHTPHLVRPVHKRKEYLNGVISGVRKSG